VVLGELPYGYGRLAGTSPGKDQSGSFPADACLRRPGM